jgi:integrative and conjugative element protein (TIGR02256 family)
MTVWLSDDVVASIRREAERLHPFETGGVLLGWRDGSDRIVMGATGPGRGAMHGRVAFLPDHPWQLARIREAFRRSGGDLDYLGDWHTHPDGAASMSTTDRQTLNRIARRVSEPVMLIAAGRSERWELASWIGLRGRVFWRFNSHRQEVRPFRPAESWPASLDFDD